MSVSSRPTDRRLRLLYLQPAVHVGGAERQASLLLPALAEAGVDTVAVAGPGHAIMDWFRRSGVPSYYWSPYFPGSGEPHVGGVPAVVRQLSRLVHQLAPLHAQQPFDLVLGSLGYGWAATGLLGRRWGVPVVWRAGGLTVGPWQQRRSIAGLGARWLSTAMRPSLLWCNAEAVRDYWAPLVHAPAVVLPNAVQVPDGVTRLVRLPGQPLRLGFLGRLAPEKDLEVLLQACARLESAQCPWRLRIAGPGSDGPLRRQIHALGLDRLVHVPGRVDDLPRFFASCDVLVLPSRVEGSPNVLAEAMAHGVPVVATRVGGTPELVRSGEDGLLVPPHDPQALAGALRWMAEHPDQARAMGQAGRRHMQGRTPQFLAYRLARLFRHLVRSPGPGQGVRRGSSISKVPSGSVTVRPASQVAPSVPTA